MRLDEIVRKNLSAPPVRRFRRASADSLAFLPHGILIAAGFVLLTLFTWTAFARHNIQDVAARAAQKVVADTGSDWATVTASGQWVWIGGQPPSPEAGDRLLDAVRKATVRTALGSARPVTRVTGDFGSGRVRPGQATGGASGASPSGDAPEFLFRLSGTKLVLDGRVPDIATRDRVIEAANTDRPSRIEEVESNLETIGIPSPDGFQDAALRGIETLKLCDAGTASFTSLQFNLRCELPARDEAQVRELASAALAYGSIGDIEVVAKEVIETCEEELARLLDASRIEFELGSDRIASSKTALLDLTARAASDCPGTLRIEGHTDNTGSLQLNEDLSRRRAEAVRAALILRGVAPSRLIAAGYGPARPIGDNTTEQGRAENRRIQISVVRASE